MTLVLGPPASGKSTLLKALAGLLTPDANFKAWPPQQLSCSGACSDLSAIFLCGWQASCKMGAAAVGAAAVRSSSSIAEKRGLYHIMVQRIAAFMDHQDEDVTWPKVP